MEVEARDTVSGREANPLESGWERHARRPSAARGSLAGGLGLTAIGTVFLLQNAGLLRPGQSVWGALVLAVAASAGQAAAGLYQASGHRFTAAVAQAVNGALIVGFVGLMLVLDLSWGMLWPVFLIIPGAMLLLGSAARADGGRSA